MHAARCCFQKSALKCILSRYVGQISSTDSASQQCVTVTHTHTHTHKPYNKERCQITYCVSQNSTLQILGICIMYPAVHQAAKATTYYLVPFALTLLLCVHISPAWELSRCEDFGAERTWLNGSSNRLTVSCCIPSHQKLNRMTMQLMLSLLPRP